MLESSYPAIWIAIKRDGDGDANSYYNYYTKDTLSGYTNWADGEPNLGVGDFGAKEDCGTLSIENGNDGKWLDHPCWQTNRRAVCKIATGLTFQSC